MRYIATVCVVPRWPMCPIFGFWGGAKFTKMGDSLPCTPMNRCAKFDVANFIRGGEIRNRTNTQKTNSQKQTVTDISTPVLLACVDKKMKI